MVHARHYLWNEFERWRMMVWPWKVGDPVIDEIIWISSALSSKLPYCPIRAMILVEERDQVIDRSSIGELWISVRRT